MRILKVMKWISVLGVMSLFLSACGKKDESKAKEKIITVSEKAISTSLYFPGTLAPISTVAVTFSRRWARSAFEICLW